MQCTGAAAAIVGTLLLDGTEDPVAVMRRGGVTLDWGGTRRVSAFREQPMPHVVDANIALPTLYLHMMDKRFFLEDGCLNTALRSANDNAEIVLVLPHEYVSSQASLNVADGLAPSLATLLAFLRSQGEPESTAPSARAGGFGPSANWSASISVSRLFFRFNASRPKCAVTLDRQLFGIPAEADIYLFAENHTSVNYMSDEVREAFGNCIQELPNSNSESLRALAIFIKVFFEGGFAYNKKIETSAFSYLPKVVGIGALGITPAFEGQGGIATGYPYHVKPQFFRWLDTVPVSIAAISSMSERHGRYGLCFTRCVFVWDGGALEGEGKLDFCAPAPHGGFFYAPADPVKYQTLGGLLYAFGEAKDRLEVAVNTNSSAPAAGGSQESDESDGDRRACVVCLSSDAIMATVPCGHRAYCSECAGEASRRRTGCPVCRAAVSSVIRIY